MTITKIAERGYWVIYVLTQAYGGREEGGWYYDVGEPVALQSAVREYFQDEQGVPCDESGEWQNYPGPTPEVQAWAEAYCAEHGLELGATRRTKSYVRSGAPDDACLSWQSESDGIPRPFPEATQSYE